MLNIKPHYYLWMLCYLLVACSSSTTNNKTTDTQPSPPSPPPLSFMEQETRIVIEWQNPVIANATLRNITIRWTSLIDDPQTYTERIQELSLLADGSQQYAIENLLNSTQYRIEIFGYYQKLEHICNDICDICYTAQRPIEEYYETLLGEGETATGLSPDNHTGRYQPPLPPTPPQLPSPSAEDPDSDQDGVVDSIDPDDDGDGLIEITTADELNSIRYVLNASGMAEVNGGNIDLITSGCEDHSNTPACYGYELQNDISLADYDWVPLALDQDNADFPVIATAFSGHFDGQGYHISDLTINQSAAGCVGLFGFVRDSDISNLSIGFNNISGDSFVGSLIGRGDDVTLTAITVEGDSIIGEDRAVAGMIGGGESLIIHHSSAVTESVIGFDTVGGLVGHAPKVRVDYSSAESNMINGIVGVGGLVGYTTDGRIRHSTTRTETIEAGVGFVGGLIGSAGERTLVSHSAAYNNAINSWVIVAAQPFFSIANSGVGGLIGAGYNMTILSSHAEGSIISPEMNAVGGLVGSARQSFIANSSARYGSIVGDRDVGGLIGSGQDSTVINSFAHKEYIDATEDGGGLIGDGERARIINSTANTTYIFANREGGGLIGDAEQADIDVCSAGFSSIFSIERAAGLIADAEGSHITDCQVTGNQIRALGSLVGGLVGYGVNLTINNTQVRISDIRGLLVGGLVGFGDGLMARRVSYQGDLLRAYSQGSAGGLVGAGSGVSLHNVTANLTFIISEKNAGGLIGEGDDNEIVSSIAKGRSIRAEFNIAGGLIGLGNRARIYRSHSNISLICGQHSAGGLVGGGYHADIRQSYAINDVICAVSAAGGLVGDGPGTSIAFSSAHNGHIHMAEQTGGLIGAGSGSVVHSSYAISNVINASANSGGLIGNSQRAVVLASYGVTNQLDSGNFAGGIMGSGVDSQIVSSYANAKFVAPPIAGGLIGNASNAYIAASYALAGPLNERGLVGTATDTMATIRHAYWDRNMSANTIRGDSISSVGGGQPSSSLVEPEPPGGRNRNELRQPTNYTGIYSTWDNLSLPVLHHGLDANLSIWCDTNKNGRIETEEMEPTNLLWDFGDSQSYPHLSCLPSPEPFSFIASTVEIDNSLFPVLPEADPVIQADPLIGSQWYLDHVGVKDLWRQNITGEGVHISIVDDALDIFHEDLLPNVVPGKSRNYLEFPDSPLYDNPEPLDLNDDSHGTAVAGILAARGDNGIGIKGVAPRAGIYLSNLLQIRTDIGIVDALTPRTNQTVVSSNSWGAIRPSLLVTARATFDMVVTEHINKGKGINYVFSAGNTREREDMASYEERLNHRGVITVCAVNIDNESAYFSNQGANLWLCAPSGEARGDECSGGYLRENINADISGCGIATTDLMIGGYNKPLLWPQPGGVVSQSRLHFLGLSHWNFGGGDFYVLENNQYTYLPPIGGNHHYTRFFRGTSASVPIVSGVIALLRSAHPQLTWRDVKLILAESANKVDKADANWQPAAPTYHNHNHFYNHSLSYGFGIIDAAKAHQIAKNWRLLPPLQHNTANVGELQGQPAQFGPLTSRQSVPQWDFDFIEWTEIHIWTDQPNFGALTLTLISPDGETHSVLTRAHRCINIFHFVIPCPVPDSGFTFATAANLGRSPQGEWQLVIEGLEEGNYFTWQLRFYGHKKR